MAVAPAESRAMQASALMGEFFMKFLLGLSFERVGSRSSFDKLRTNG
jgi:hypothetical protein